MSGLGGGSGGSGGAGLDRVPVIAVHTDFIADIAETHFEGGSAALATNHLATLRTGGIDCICEHVIGDTFEALCFPTRAIHQATGAGQRYPPSSLKHALRLLVALLVDVEQSSGDFVVATTAAEIRSAAARGRIAVVLCFQGLTPCEGDPDMLAVFHRLGLRIAGITTNTDNAAGRSQLGRGGGLTGIGKALVRRAHELRMLIDVSHLSDQGIADVLDIVGGPVIASNSNTRHHHDIPRNLSDDMLRAIAASGGVVGVHANGDLITSERPVTLDHLADHVCHIVDLVGIDHAAIGPDLVDDSMYPARRYREIMAGKAHFSAPYPEGLRDHGDLPALTAVLARRGFADADLRQITGGNALRVFEAAWGA